MDTINLIRPVLVKVRVTEAYKKLVAAELQEVLKRIELEMQSLDFQIRRLDSGLDRKNSQEASVARQRLEQERSLRQEKRRQLLDKLKEIGQLAPGTEVFLSKMESMVELKPGDEWSKVLGVEIIIQDGVVVEIRQGQTGKDPYHE